MLSKLSRRRGLQLEALGSVLICTVMLADRFLFTLQDGFVLTTAIISAVLLTIGIRARREKSELILRAFLIPQPPEFTPLLEKACAVRSFLFLPHFAQQRSGQLHDFRPSGTETMLNEAFAKIKNPRLNRKVSKFG